MDFCLDSCSNTLDSHTKSPTTQSTIRSVFRNLRNYCSGGNSCQDEIYSAPILIDRTRLILNGLVAAPSEENIETLRIGLQFLANSIVENSSAQAELVHQCGNLLLKCICLEDNKVQTYCAMIFYNMLLGGKVDFDYLKQTIGQLIQLTLKEETSEFPIYFLEYAILNKNLIIDYYEELNSQQQLTILELIINLLNSNKKLPITTVVFLVQRFKKTSDCILKTVSSYIDNIEPWEATKLLDILAKITGDNEDIYLCKIQRDKAFLINCVFLLKSIHSAGKETDNNFSSIQKLAELSGKNDTLTEHPAFGFKSTLIRTVGNLCWRHDENQDLVRELDGISLVLDCCNIDARNPFILQWGILAIHNLCYKNLKNQVVIASLTKEGVVDSALLKEMGISLNTDDGGLSLCMAPLKLSN